MSSSNASSSNIRRTRPPEPQVFINIRGEELREGFLKTLEEVLRKEQVNVYINRDDELRGEELKLHFRKIQRSKIAITIFSERYTDSKKCLDELVKIKECLDKGTLRVFPIFLDVEAEEVKSLTRDFGENFVALKNKYHRQNRMTKKWQDALELVSGEFGLPSNIRFLIP